MAVRYRWFVTETKSSSTSRRDGSTCCVEDDELARRRQQAAAAGPTALSGYGELFVRHVTQANLGCDFDFLHGPAGVAEPLIY